MGSLVAGRLCLNLDILLILLPHSDQHHDDGPNFGGVSNGYSRHWLNLTPSDAGH